MPAPRFLYVLCVRYWRNGRNVFHECPCYSKADAYRQLAAALDRGKLEGWYIRVRRDAPGPDHGVITEDFDAREGYSTAH